MKVKELLEKRAALVSKVTAFQAIETEKRTADQIAGVQATLAEIAALDKTIELEGQMALATRNSLTSALPPNGKRKYSLRNVILSQLAGNEACGNIDAGYEREISQELSKRSGLQAAGFLVPFESQPAPTFERRDNTTVNMGALIQTDIAAATPYLYPVTVFDKLGVTRREGLIGDIVFPISTTSCKGTAKGETAAADQITYTWTEMKMTPHRLPVEVRVSRQTLLQNPTTEVDVQTDIRTGMASQIENYGFNGTGQNGQPLGLLGHTISTRTNTSTKFDLVDAVACVNTMLAQNRSGLLGTLAWAVHPTAATFIESTPVTTYAGRLVMQDNVMAAYPVNKTTNLPANTAANCVVFGDWSQMIHGSWGAMELIVDQYTLAGTGIIKLNAAAFFDIGVKRPLFFVGNTGAISAVGP